MRPLLLAFEMIGSCAKAKEPTVKANAAKNFAIYYLLGYLLIEKSSDLIKELINII